MTKGAVFAGAWACVWVLAVSSGAEERRYDLASPDAPAQLAADGWRPSRGWQPSAEPSTAHTGDGGLWFRGPAEGMILAGLDGGTQPWSRVSRRWTVEAEVEPGQCGGGPYGSILQIRDESSAVGMVIGRDEFIVYRTGYPQPLMRHTLDRDAGEGPPLHLVLSSDGRAVSVRLGAILIDQASLGSAPPLLGGLNLSGDWRRQLASLTESDPREIQFGAVDACPVPSRWRALAYDVPEGDHGGRKEWPEVTSAAEVLEPLASGLPPSARQAVERLQVKVEDAPCAAAAALDVGARVLMPLAIAEPDRAATLRRLPPTQTRAQRIQALASFPDPQRWRKPFERIEKLPISDPMSPRDHPPDYPHSDGRLARRERTLDRYEECLCRTPSCAECLTMLSPHKDLGLESNQRFDSWPPTFEYRFDPEEVRGVVMAFAHSMVWDSSAEHLNESMRQLGGAFRAALEHKRKGAAQALEVLKQRMLRARRAPGGSCKP